MSKKIGYFKPFKRIINFEIAIYEKIHEVWRIYTIVRNLSVEENN